MAFAYTKKFRNSPKSAEGKSFQRSDVLKNTQISKTARPIDTLRAGSGHRIPIVYYSGCCPAIRD